MLSKIAAMVEAAEDGNANPLEVYAEIEILLKELKLAKDQIFQLAYDEAEKQNDKTFEMNGFKFERRDGGGRFDYKGIDYWELKKKELDGIQSLMQQAYKAFQGNGSTIVDENGEVVPIPIYKPNKGSLSVKKI